MSGQWVHTRVKGVTVRKVAIIALLSVLLAACRASDNGASSTTSSGGNGGTSTGTATYRAPLPAVPDSTLLPSVVPPVAMDTANVDSVAADLVRRAHSASPDGLLALVQLAQASGMDVVDASLKGKLVFSAVSQPRTGTIEAGQLLAIHDLIAGNQTTGLDVFTSALNNIVFGIDGFSGADRDIYADSLASLQQDLVDAMDSGEISWRVWAAAVNGTDGTNGTSPILPAGAHEDIQLDAIQSVFLLKRTIADDIRSLRATGVTASGSATTRASALAVIPQTSDLVGGEVVQADDSESPCDLEGEINQEILDLGINMGAAGKEFLHDHWLEHWVEEETYVGRGDRMSDKAAQWAALQALVPILEVILARIAFRVDFVPARPALQRTASNTADGQESGITGQASYHLPLSHLGHCLGQLVSLLATEVNIGDGPLKNVGTYWDLTEGSGYMQFCQHCAADGVQSGQVMGGYTDNDGKASIVVQGKKQKEDLSGAPPVERSGRIELQVNPNKLKDNTANLIKTIWQAVSTAISSLNPPAALSKAGAHMAYDLGLFQGNTSVKIKDWSEQLKIRYQLDEAAPDLGPLSATSGRWLIKGTITVTRDPDDPTGTIYSGTGALDYAEATYQSSYESGASSDVADPTEGNRIVCGQNTCGPANCVESATSRDSGTRDGALDAILTVTKDDSGAITGVKDLTYSIRGLGEYERSDSHLTGACVYKGTHSKVTGPTRTLERLATRGLVRQLQQGDKSKVQWLADMDFTRTGFVHGADGTNIIGQSVDTYPSRPGVGGHLDERIWISP